MDALIEILSLDLFEPSEVAKQKCVILRIYNKMTKNERMVDATMLYVLHMLSNHKTVFNPPKSNEISL